MVQTVANQVGSLKVWDGISYGARIYLNVFYREYVDAHRYMKEILHDNARAHTACLTNEYLKQVGGYSKISFNSVHSRPQPY